MREADGSPGPPRGARGGEPVAPLQCTDGPTLCRVRVWSDAEWDALPPADRPRRAERVAGLGWVVAVPEVVIN